MALNASHEVIFGEGSVVHSRPVKPKHVKNSFRYSVFNLLIPVHNQHSLYEINKSRVISVLAEDYLEGKAGSLTDNIKQFLQEKTGQAFDEIWLQTLPRVFGYVFNPISFWYCYKDQKLAVVLCEVNNTFGERHFYILDKNAAVANDRFQTQTLKQFHVSPFFAVSGHYKFEFAIDEKSSLARIQLFDETTLKLDTCIHLKLRPFKSVSTSYIVRKYGWLTVLVVLRIHLQALKLWFKGAQFFRKPPLAKVRTSYDFKTK